ncbi:uncharacterized protein J3R85_001953 [Psidium guajava]|nr:uncharacterized protein J3R85_001953 [Psidium guajava]
MDNKSSPCKEAADELTRELLIAISYLEPDTASKISYLELDTAGNMNVQPQSFDKANGDAMTNNDDTEKYRSELMSISELPPPKTSPPPKASPPPMDP